MKISDLRGRPILGAFAEREVKIIEDTFKYKPLQISTVIRRFTQNKIIYYEVKISRFPKDIIFTLPQSYIKNMDFTISALREKKALDTNKNQ